MGSNFDPPRLMAELKPKRAAKKPAAKKSAARKTTKKALEDQRISSEKIEWALGKLGDLRRSSFVDEDARIFPGWFAPVMVAENGRRVLRPMRPSCHTCRNRRRIWELRANRNRLRPSNSCPASECACGVCPRLCACAGATIPRRRSRPARCA